MGSSWWRSISAIPTEGYGSPGNSGNIMVTRAAKHNVPTKKAIASVLSLISFSHFEFDMLLINMSNLVFMLILDNLSQDLLE
jgi:hypothetical protein